MRMDLNLSQRLEQRQVLSQQLIQNMELLQVPILELSQLIMQELEQNPTLELKQDVDEPTTDDKPAATETPAKPDGEGEKLDFLDQIESDRETFRAMRSTAPSTDDESRQEYLQNLTPETLSIRQHLLEQLHNTEVDDDVRKVAESVINNVDEKGFLRFSPGDVAAILSNAYKSVEYEDLLTLVNSDPPRYRAEAIAKILEKLHPDVSTDDLAARVRQDPVRHTHEALAAMLQTSFPDKGPDDLIAMTRKAIELIQTFEPRGVAAVDTQECFLLQLDPKSPDYPRLKYLIDRHLDAILHNRLPKMVRDFQESPEAQAIFGFNVATPAEEILEELKDWIDEIKRLNPSPGATFASESTHVVTPDIIVRQMDGKLDIMLEESYLPPIAINRSYIDMVRSGKLTAPEKDYIKRKIEASKRIINAIEHRRHTLYRITDRLLEHQHDFFEKGVEALKPLTMTDLAGELGIHVSTVARAVAGKYLQTPRGIFSMRFFFAQAAPANTPGPTPLYALPSHNGEPDQQTRLVVIDRIREIVGNENSKKPLSDKQIGQKLSDLFQIRLKRRTITKYREESGIPSSRLRKKY